MDVTLAKTTAEQAISTLDGALEKKPTGLSRLLLAYSPEIIRSFLKKGRLRLIDLSHHEELLDGVFKSILETKKNLLLDSKNTQLLRFQLDQLEKEYRILHTVKCSLPHILKNSNESHYQYTNFDSESLWWDMFEELASRRNEDWRVELFAKCLATNDERPGAIALKSLWELAMMETSDFGSLSLFLDSSVFIDGKPIVLMEPEEQYQYEPELNEFEVGNLAFCISGLINKGLIQKANTQFMTTEPVNLTHKSGPTILTHIIRNKDCKDHTAIRIDGFSPTDHCLDLCHLYEPKFNIASERNLEILKESLLESSNEDENSNYIFDSIKL